MRGCSFGDSSAFFGRWKSSHSVIANNSFYQTDGALLELQVLGSFYEGPVLVDDVRIENNSFEVRAGPAPIAASLVVARNWSTGIAIRGNRVWAP